MQPGIGGGCPSTDRAMGREQRELEKYVGKSLGKSATEEGKHPVDVMLDLSLATDLEGGVPAARAALQRRIHGRDHQRTRPSPSPAFPTAARIPSSSPAAPSPPTSCAGWSATSRRSRSKRRTIGSRRCRRMRPASENRGTLREGAHADVVVYDLEGPGREARLGRRGCARFAGRRMASRAAFAPVIDRSIVNGVETFADGKCTGATPGKLLRNGHA